MDFNEIIIEFSHNFTSMSNNTWIEQLKVSYFIWKNWERKPGHLSTYQMFEHMNAKTCRTLWYRLIEVFICTHSTFSMPRTEMVNDIYIIYQYVRSSQKDEKKAWWINHFGSSQPGVCTHFNLWIGISLRKKTFCLSVVYLYLTYTVRYRIYETQRFACI